MIDINYYASQKIRQLRKQNNYTQEELANKLNVTQQQVARIETNKRKIKQDILYKLAEIFDVSIDYFVPYADKTNEHIKRYNELNTKNQSVVNDVIDSLYVNQEKEK